MLEREAPDRRDRDALNEWRRSSSARGRLSTRAPLALRTPDPTATRSLTVDETRTSRASASDDTREAMLNPVANDALLEETGRGSSTASPRRRQPIVCWPQCSPTSSGRRSERLRSAFGEVPLVRDRRVLPAKPLHEVGAVAPAPL